MKESLRRVILFAVVVVTGSMMILFDVPPVLMVPLLILVGFVILLGLGAVTVTDLREIIKSAKPGNLKKISILKRLDEMKFFEKKPPAAPGKQSQPLPAKAQKPAKPIPAKPVEKKPGILSHLALFVSSLGSLGAVFKQRTKSKNVEDIDKLLDKTVSEKVSGSALASAGNVSGSARQPDTGGAGSSMSPPLPSAEQDPFLSLSGDEFDAGLLDGLDDGESGGELSTGTHENAAALPGAEDMANESSIPIPSLDISSEADEILKGNSPGPDEFSGLEGGDSIDQDFGDFGDLDDLNLDDITLDDEDDGAKEKTQSPDETPKENTLSMPSGPAVKEIKTDWVKSDAPQSGKDEVSTQADMAAFASNAGTDEDLLSSIASDVKHTKKEKDISLLRELKDFKAPAEEIEQELILVSERIHAVPKVEKSSPQTKEIK